MGKTYTYDEVQQHRSSESCWVVLYGDVYDVTSFLPDHPGGSRIILQLAGTDATEEYDPIHPPGTLESNLPTTAKLGPFDFSALPEKDSQKSQQGQSTSADQPTMTLADCLNIDDIETVAAQNLSRRAWAYYFSAGDDLISKSFNNAVYRNILLRPRIFRDCTRCDTTTTLFGEQGLRVGVPFFVSPAAMARLGHPDGEVGIAHACARFGAMQVISNNASQTPEKIVADAAPDQIFGWQMYVQNTRRTSEEMLDRIARLPNIRFICLTLDAPVPGKREHDERTKGDQVRSAVNNGTTSNEEAAGGGVGKALFWGTAADLTWRTTLPWLREHTNLPIVLKGVQTHEDAYIASLHAPQVQGIILSNHGGRAMDTSPPAMHTLLEIRKYCPEVFKRIDVWVDGGVKRGTDVVKALCLGAKAVGLGRAPLYGLGAGGTKGVERVFEILKGETETAMRLLGCEKIDYLGLRHVNARRLERDLYDGPAGLDELGELIKSKL